MKLSLLPLLLVCAFVFPGLAADEPKSRLAQIDLELTLEQYKQARMEQFRTKMQLELLAAEGASDGKAQAHQRERLKERSDILQRMVDDTRIRVLEIEDEGARREVARKRVEANVGELKFIGDRHWSVSRLKPGTGRLDDHMGGTYTLNGNEYVETVEYGTGGPIGETFTYKLTIEDDKFTQIGVG